MRSNEHGGDRSGVWSTEGLEGAALSIVKGDEKSGRCASEHSAIPVYLGCRNHVALCSSTKSCRQVDQESPGSSSSGRAMQMSAVRGADTRSKLFQGQ